MTFPRRRVLGARVAVVGVLAGAALLAPVQMAQGAPTTRFATLPVAFDAAPAGAIQAAGLAGPDTPPAAGPVTTTSFPLSHLAVRWQGSEEAQVDARVAGDGGRWGPWRRMAVDHDLEDEASGRFPSQLIRVDGARKVQLRAAGDARRLEVIAIDTVNGPRPWVLARGEARAQAADPPPDEPDAVGAGEAGTRTTAAAGDRDATTPTKVEQPKVVTRAQWGADESFRKGEPKFAPIKKLFVHHTVTSPGPTDPDPASTVRAIYAYHTKGNGWDDIGYNFLVDHTGTIYEGRWARAYKAGEIPTGEDEFGYGVVGAHVSGHNFGSAGISLIGDFTGAEPTSMAMAALERMLSWKADRHDIDVTASDPFTATDGTTRAFPNLAGHRDAGRTACPGDRLYAQLPKIRTRVASLVQIAHSPIKGYWTATADGRVLPFGEAPVAGSMAGKPLNAPIVGMASTPSGNGYWLMGGDGGIFSFGDAKFYGSTGAMVLNQPVVGMATTPTGRGYWLVASDGGIFSFGDALFYGSTGSLRLNSPVVSMAPAANGTGYWLVARDGGVFAFDVGYFGSIPGLKVESFPGSVQLRATPAGRGYYIADQNGGIFTFGDARFHGADAGLRPPHGAVDLVIRPVPVEKPTTTSSSTTSTTSTTTTTTTSSASASPSASPTSTTSTTSTTQAAP